MLSARTQTKAEQTWSLLELVLDCASLAIIPVLSITALQHPIHWPVAVNGAKSWQNQTRTPGLNDTNHPQDQGQHQRRIYLLIIVCPGCSDDEEPGEAARVSGCRVLQPGHSCTPLIVNDGRSHSKLFYPNMDL